VQRRQYVVTSVEHSCTVKQQLSYDELLRTFILDCKSKNLSPLTLRFYQDSARQMQEAFQAQQITLDIYNLSLRETKNHFIAYLFDQGKSDNTVNGRMNAMKQFLRFLFKEGWITENISESLHVVKAEKLMLQTFTKEQVASLLEQPNLKTFTGYRDFTMMVLLLATGMRIMNGGDPFTLRRILGHATLDMVDWYVELFSSNIKQQHKKFSPIESGMVRANVAQTFRNDGSIYSGVFNKPHYLKIRCIII